MADRETIIETGGGDGGATGIVIAAIIVALLIAGGFHVRRDLGVPLHLEDLGAGEGMQVLMLAEVGKTVSPQQADYAWYTPALPPQDHCAKLR